jgi:hypothetical protein
MLPLTEDEQELLKKQKNDYLYLILGFLLITCIFSYWFYTIYTNQQIFEMKLTIVLVGLMWIGAILYIGKTYWDITEDLKLNYKLKIEGTVEKISFTIGEHGGNTFVFMYNKKYSIPKEARIEYSNGYDFIQEGDQAILYVAPKSKILIGVQRITKDNDY